MVKNSPAKAGDLRDVGSFPGLRRSPGRGHGNLLQYSCLENPMDRENWQATVHGVAKSWTRLKRQCAKKKKKKKNAHACVKSQMEKWWERDVTI